MVSCGISTPFGVLFPSKGEVAHALLTRPPLKQPEASFQLSPLDLHVLGTPPAFVLSQDQTLKFDSMLSNFSPCVLLSVLESTSHLSKHLLSQILVSCLVFASLMYRFQGSSRSQEHLSLTA